MDTNPSRANVRARLLLALFCGLSALTCSGEPAATDDPPAQNVGAVKAGGSRSCTAAWSPFWQQTSFASEWWAEFSVTGGGSLARSVSFQVVGGAKYALSYSSGKWTGGINGVPTGSQVVLSATDATGATAQTYPFAYLVNASPVTDPCSCTPPTSKRCVPLSRGMVTISMDDSYPSQATLAGPVMKKYSVKATINHITNNLSVYGELPYAKQLAADGHEVASHTVSHPDLTTLTAQQLDDELRLSQQYLLANVGSPVASFASPMGSYNDAVLVAIKRYYKSHRTVNPGLNYMGSDIYQLNADAVTNTWTVDYACSVLQDAARNKGWRIFFFHDFITDAVSTNAQAYPIADFDSILACARSTAGLDIVTTAQGAALLTCASP